MKTLLKIVLPALAAILAGGDAFAGQWGTDYGTLSLPDEPDAGSVHAPYSVDNGRIIGRILKPKCVDCGVMLSGVWVEAGSNEACSTEKDGSAHWGDVQLQFNAGFTSFTGTWNYCGAGAGHPWKGKLGASKGGGQNR